MSGSSEREKRRQERIESESTDAGSNRNRLIVGYAIASTVVLAIAAAVLVLSSGGSGGGTAKGDAHINLNASIGSTNGVEPDNRAGTVPAAVKVTDLQAAAKQAGCKVRLGLKDEGNSHIPQGSPAPDYKTNPPTSGNHVDPTSRPTAPTPKRRRKSTTSTRSSTGGWRSSTRRTCPKRTSWR
jgi:hypothetical protein